MRIFLFLVLTVLLNPTAAAARCGVPKFESPVYNPSPVPPGASGCGVGTPVEYGGTIWAADSLRWEAIRDGEWTFESGVGSSINNGSNPNKPAGYHKWMEGWYGEDLTLCQLPYFRRTGICAISGNFSFHAGISTIEAGDLVYAGGQGYGNNWDMTIRKDFNYGGTGNVRLTFDYAVSSELNCDFLELLVDTTGTAELPPIVLSTFSGSEAGNRLVHLYEGENLRSDNGPITLSFRVRSDGAYSDEDGLYDTACGLATIDNITLSFGITDVSNFESGSDGWVQVVPIEGVGDFTTLRGAGDLPIPAMLCACGMVDSVLVFSDSQDEHPYGQDNVAVSPMIRLAPQDLGFDGRYVRLDLYGQMPLQNYVFLGLRVRSWPTASKWQDYPLRWYFNDAPWCTPAPHFVDISGLVPPSAEQIQIGFRVTNLCGLNLFGPQCTGNLNSSPWIDNVAVGVYSTGGSALTMLAMDKLQDNFATDGTLNPAAPARVDVARIKNAAFADAGTEPGDTLVVYGGDADDVVEIVFRVRTGPFTNLGALSAWAADPLGGGGPNTRWVQTGTLAPGYFGGFWQKARLDVAKQGALDFPGRWMSTVHEAQIFPPTGAGAPPGWDRTADPYDASELRAEIFPDNILTPGSRIDYYIRSVGACSYNLPDGPGGTYFEMEVLPSSTAADSTWNCVLYIDGHGDRDAAEAAVEEAGLNYSLGFGGNNAEGTRFDRFDIEAPTSLQSSFGRPLRSRWGAGQLQVEGYRSIAWHAGRVSQVGITSLDAAILNPWLLRESDQQHFWLSGDNVASTLDNAGGIARTFLNNSLGVQLNCTGILLAACPSGSPLDALTCRGLAPVAGAHFSLPVASSVQDAGCPSRRYFDLLTVSPTIVTARGNLAYVKASVNRNHASVTNHNTVDATFRTVVDGFAIGTVRDAGTCPTGFSASYERTDEILDWFGTSGNCRIPSDIVGLPDPEAPRPITIHALGRVLPNPLRTASSIEYQVAEGGGRVRLQIIDVAGRLVRTLLDDLLPPGAGQVSWDGRNSQDRAVSAGMYYARLSIDDGRFVQTRSLVVLR